MTPFLITLYADVMRSFPIEIAFWDERDDICQPHRASQRMHSKTDATHLIEARIDSQKVRD